jgi:hypothetical protein
MVFSLIYRKLCYAHIYPGLRHLTNQWHDRRRLDKHLQLYSSPLLASTSHTNTQKETDNRNQYLKMVSLDPETQTHPSSHSTPTTTTCHLQSKHPTQNITPPSTHTAIPIQTNNFPITDPPNNISNNPLPPDIPRRRNRLCPHRLNPKHSSRPLRRLRLPPSILPPARRPILWRGAWFAGVRCARWQFYSPCDQDWWQACSTWVVGSGYLWACYLWIGFSGEEGCLRGWFDLI